MAAAACAALGVTAAVFAVLGADVRGTKAALAATARLAFLPFWLAYTGGALTTLFGDAFKPLRRYGRELGLAFAAAQTIHVGLVAWLSYLGATPARGTFIFFGGALACAYLLALFSIPTLFRLLDAKSWWLLRTVGLNYIALAFAEDFIKFPFLGTPRHMLEYLPFATLAIVGPLLRLAAAAIAWGRVLASRDEKRPGSLPLDQAGG
jgi:hypothetical protein